MTSLVVPRIMFDNGACRHMWGTDLVEAGLVRNIREVEPHRVDTASDQIALNQMGDIKMGNHELMAGYLNPYMGLSLVSQGLLSKYEGWSFLEADGELQVNTPVDEFEAEMHGPLAFWPSGDIIQELTKTQDLIVAAIPHVGQGTQPGCTPEGLSVPQSIGSSLGTDKTAMDEPSIGPEVPPTSLHTGETTETDEDTLSDGPGSAYRPQSAADPDPVL